MSTHLISHPDTNRIVLGFGSLSLTDLPKVAAMVVDAREAGKYVSVTVSGDTQAYDAHNTAFDVASKGPFKGVAEREMAAMRAASSQITAALLATHILQLGVAARSLSAWQVPLYTINQTRVPRFDIQGAWENNRAETLFPVDGTVHIVCGSQALDRENTHVHFGRHGYQDTAVAMACISEATCYIYSDGPPLRTGNLPGISTSAIAELSYNELKGFVAGGHNGLSIEAINTAAEHQLPLRLLDASDSDFTGTLVHNHEKISNNQRVIGIICAQDKNIDRIAVTVIGENLTGDFDTTSQEILFRQGIITSEWFDVSPERSLPGTSLEFTVPREDVGLTVKLLHKNYVNSPSA